MTTSAPATDERLHWAALEALLSGPLNGQVYDYGTVPGDENNPVEAQRAKPLPNIFVLLTVERRYVGPRRAGRAGRSGWRITARYVGRTVNEARWALDKVTDAIDEIRLTVDGAVSTPVTQESATAIEVDDGRFSGLTAWTYAL